MVDQVSVFHVFERHEDVLAVLEDFVKLDDIRLPRDCFEDFDFFFDLLPRIVLIERFLRNDFQGDFFFGDKTGG